MKNRNGLCINIKIGLGNKSRLLELGAKDCCDITGVKNKDYHIIAFLF